jgi:hypothetical protein
MKIFVSTTTLAFLLLATAAAGRTGGGLRGKVLIEPAFPVCHVDQPCTKPAGNVLLVFMRGGLARRTRTAEDGTYRLRLAPGRYKVAAPSPGLGRVRVLDPTTVVVPRARYRHVTFTLDIGIK